ncbi:hypothetical protein FIBSPDRAFT_960329 [Athelia psychrophila]|uniref:Uncharacterized protein n=1 Tax=Athelia psychrophila TaxID=1759441 RepID=A0A166CGW7_9AGAM|nr:hypothetical protein FIBSPDRAFT_960329 [Fibularhizoctonia sp. CBS 109695]
MVSSPVYTREVCLNALLTCGADRAQKIAAGAAVPPIKLREALEGEEVLSVKPKAKRTRAKPKAKSIVREVQGTERQTDAELVQNQLELPDLEQPLPDSVRPETATVTNTEVQVTETPGPNSTARAGHNVHADNMRPNEDITDDWPEHSVDLVDVINASDPSVNVKMSLLGRYMEDPFFRLIIDVPTSYKNFEYRGGLVYVKDKEWCALCIPDVIIGN